MGARHEIALAVNAAPYYSQNLAPGSGHVRLDRTEYPNRLGGVCFWNVVFMLPQDLAAAEQWIEKRVPALREALADVMTVTQVRPEQLQIPNVGLVPCVFINGHRAEED